MQRQDNMITNAFTCTGPYAILILTGIKQTENRSAWPEPREGRAVIPIAKDYEGFFVLPIDAERRPICKPILVSLGHIRGTTAVEFREVFREAFMVNADAIIVAHNHPSGDPTPSKADLQLTTALQSAANLLGVKFLDHLILGSPDCEEGRGFVSEMEQTENGAR